MLKIISLFLILSFSLNLASAASSDYNIESVDSTVKDTLKIFLDKEVSSADSNLTWEIKILKDIKVSSIEKIESNKKAIKISLDKDLEKNNSYSILSVNGIKWDIDFALNENSIGQTIKNSDNTENLDSIKVISSKIIEAYFKTDIVSQDIEARFYKNVEAEKISINSTSKKEIDIKLKTSLEENSQYLLMLFSLKTIEDNELAFPEWLYEVNTLSFNDKIVKKVVEEAIDETMSNAITNVASQAKEIPATWTETWVLILATFIMSSVVFLRKRIKGN